jgi:hypothetical protein
MSKETVQLTMTTEQMNKIKERSELDCMPISSLLASALKKWYEANKNQLDINQTQDHLLMCNFRVDEETEKIYKMFIQDTLKNLIDLL